MNQPSVGTSLDVQSFINSQPLSRYQWRVVILCFLIVFLDGLDTAAMGCFAPALSQDWGIDRAIKQVAHEAGFTNDKSFIRAFRTWTGQSPAEFRRNARAD